MSELNNEKMPLLSILIPLYNAEKYISMCVESIINQYNGEIEIVILDDGSTDNSLSIIRDLVTSMTWIKVLEQKNEHNILQTRKKLINSARGEYVVFVDSDDVLKEKAIEVLCKTIKNSNADIILYDYEKKIDNKIVESSLDYDKDLNSQDKVEALMRLLITDNRYHSVWSKCFKKNLFNGEIFNRKIDLSVCEDALLCIIATSNAQKIEVLSKVLYTYRIEGQGITNKYKFWYYDDFNIYYNSLIDLIKSKELDKKYLKYVKQYYMSLMVKFFCKIQIKNKQDKKVFDKLVNDLSNNDNFNDCYVESKEMPFMYNIVLFLLRHKYNYLLILIGKLVQLFV